MSVQDTMDQMMQRAMLDRQRQEAETLSQRNQGTQQAEGGGPVAAGPSEAPKKTVDEVVAELRTSPLFMEELDTESEDIQALQALAFEGTPLENATSFKDQGNECFKLKRHPDAREFYTKGIDILAHEERKRRRGETTFHLEAADSDGREVEVEDDDEEIGKQRATLEALYVNRGACALEVKNYRSCWLDCGHALLLNPRNIKAFYRSSRALLAVGRIDEADDACARGLEVDPSNVALQAVAGEIVEAAKKQDAKRKVEATRVAKERAKAQLLAAALKARNVRTRVTEKPPEMEDARVRLVPDEEDPHSALVFPVLLFYPADYETDFIKAFGEADSLADHLGYVFPLPWDKEGRYTVDGVECYVETVSGGLVKWGKKVPLLKVLGTGNVEVVDSVLKVFVLPKAKAAAWVDDFKKQKAARKT